MVLLDCFTELIAYTGYLLENDKNGTTTIEEVYKTFELLISRSKECASAGEFSETEWTEAFFPICAYIDEQILVSDWVEKGRWVQSQLQRKYFNTTNAGGEFFKKLENLDGATQGVREVFEFCLTLGFKGSYYHAADVGRLEDIRYTNLKRVTDNINLAYPESLFPEAYGSDTADTSRKKRRWQGQSSFSITVIILPPLVFGALYYALNSALTDMIHDYFGAAF